MQGDTTNTQAIEIMTQALNSEVEAALKKLSKQPLFDPKGQDYDKTSGMSCGATNRLSIQSPEEEKETHQTNTVQSMKFCMNLDEFFDVVFQIEGKFYIKGNSVVLSARSEYFSAMFNSQHKFKETSDNVY